jgi:hypothetical protein
MGLVQHCNKMSGMVRDDLIKEHTPRLKTRQISRVRIGGNAVKPTDLQAA